MTIQERLTDAMKTAMKAQDGLRLNTIRMARTAIKNAEIEARGPLDDAAVIKVLSTDANKVTQVAWMTSEGTVIATALERHMGDTLLAPLDETVRVHGIIADTVRGARRSGGSTFFSGKRLASP